jgi:hypothetical protein
MVNRSTILKIIVLLVVVSVAASCILDPQKEPDKPPTVTVSFETLKEKDHTLINLELLFNEYNVTEYKRLLNDNFIFFFSDADFSSGKTPEQWDWEVETRSYGNFYDTNRSENRVTSNTLNLTFAVNNWTEVTPDDQVTYPDESWFVSTVTYDMSVVLDTTPELTLVANGLKAEITIRWDETLEHYQIIRWRDDVSG